MTIRYKPKIKPLTFNSVKQYWVSAREDGGEHVEEGAPSSRSTLYCAKQRSLGMKEPSPFNFRTSTQGFHELMVPYTQPGHHWKRINQDITTYTPAAAPQLTCRCHCCS